MWELIKTTNNKMFNFVGMQCDIFTPRRKQDGHKVLYVTEPGSKDNWYFYTSTIQNMTRRQENGSDIVEFRTSNSTYVFRAYKW